jgi:hypothetical protein
MRDAVLQHNAKEALCQPNAIIAYTYKRAASGISCSTRAKKAKMHILCAPNERRMRLFALLSIAYTEFEVNIYLTHLLFSVSMWVMLSYIGSAHG